MKKFDVIYEIHDHYSNDVERDLKMHIEAKTKGDALLEFIDNQQEILDVYVRDMYGFAGDFDYDEVSKINSTITIMIVGASYD